MEPTPDHTPPIFNSPSSDSASPIKYLPPVAFFFGLIVVLLGMLMLSVQFGVKDGLSFSPFNFGPLILAFVPMWLYRSERCQAVFLFADIAYLTWFLIYLQIGSANLNDFNAFVVGSYSLPVLIVLCTIAALIHRQDSLLPPTAVSPVSSAPPLAFYLGVPVVIAGTLMLSVHFGFIEGIFGLPIAFGPLMLAWIPMWLCRSKRSQGVLVFANVVFVCWFLYVYLPMRNPHNWSEFDVLGIIAIGLYSFPVLLVLCIIAVVLHRQDSISNG
jgi:hypothetical protein